MKKTDKKIISLLLVLIILISQFSVVVASTTEIVEKQSYEGLDDYLKEFFWKYDGDYNWSMINNIDYENLDKTQINELMITSTIVVENFKPLPLIIDDFEELYKYTNLSVLILDDLQNIEKIDFSRLTNLKEIYIREGCTLEGKISFDSLNLEHININLKCDLSNAVIEVDEEIWSWKNGSLGYMDLTLDSSRTENFYPEKVFPGATDFMGSVYGNVWNIFAAYGIGSEYLWNIDTLDNYMKLYHPGESKQEIKELDLYNVADLSSIEEFENLEKLIINEEPEILEDGTQKYRQLDLRNLKNLKVLKYIYSTMELDEIKTPVLGVDIIYDDYSKIKYKKLDGYSGMYYFGVDYDNVLKEENSLNIKSIGETQIITKIQENQTVEELKNKFDDKYSIQVYNSEYEFVEENTSLGTGMKVNIYDEDNIFVGEYTVVIYGDTDGDAEITATDALTVIKVVNKKIEAQSDAHVEAGKVTGQDEISAIDALAIIKHLNERYEISQDI